VHRPTGLSSVDSGNNATAVVRGRVEALRVEPPRAFYVLGSEPRLRARATFDDGGAENIGSDVDWTSSDTSIAEIGTQSPKRGILQSKRVGKITVSAVEPVSGVSTTASGGDGVVVIVDGLERLRVRDGNLELRTGDTVRLRAVGIFPHPAPDPGETDRVEVDMTDEVTWTSSNPAVARIEGGQLLAVGLGETTVTAQDRKTGILSSQSGGDALFRVIAALQQVGISPRTVRTRLGSSRRRGLEAVGLYSDEARIEITDRVTFETADGSVARVSNERDRHGLVEAVGVGKTTASAVEPVTGIRSARSSRIIVKGAKGRRRGR
jgi:hypothetical protein